MQPSRDSILKAGTGFCGDEPASVRSGSQRRGP